MSLNSQRPCKGQIYKHYKGQNYLVHDVVRHSETLEELVLYETLYDCELGKMWVRPMEMFMGKIEIDGKMVQRFALESSHTSP